MQRVIEPEILDELPAEDPRAIHSRADLRRVNWFMNNPGTVAQVMRGMPVPKRILDLGAGDGSFALRVAQLCRWRAVEFILLDRTASLSKSDEERFRRLDCHATSLQREALAGLHESGAVDVIWANLFLHHFKHGQLKHLLTAAAQHCALFVACEPQRSSFGLLGSRLLGLLGCNAVTRHDAITSVRAGFRDNEITLHWPIQEGWSIQERPAGLFSHLFVARRL